MFPEAFQSRSVDVSLERLSNGVRDRADSIHRGGVRKCLARRRWEERELTGPIVVEEGFV